MADDFIDVVARSLFHSDTGSPVPFEEVARLAQDRYRALARAAIDALGLQVQWGWQLGDNTPSVYPSEQQARDRVAYLDTVFQVGTERHIVHRLTTPWTRDTTDAPATT